MTDIHSGTDVQSGHICNQPLPQYFVQPPKATAFPITYTKNYSIDIRLLIYHDNLINTASRKSQYSQYIY